MGWGGEQARDKANTVVLLDTPGLVLYLGCAWWLLTTHSCPLLCRLALCPQPMTDRGTSYLWVGSPWESNSSSKAS